MSEKETTSKAKKNDHAKKRRHVPVRRKKCGAAKHCHENES